MAPQHVEVLETLINLKRKIRRDKEASFAQPITSATNRYHKLQKGASYVHAGALPYPRGPEGYKQTIEHAGYTRSILARNPSRFNEYGEELEDEESDPEADADAQEENPYTGIHLEELLAPLKHPSELATHPTLSVPYVDSALPNLVKSLEDTLRTERANLWRAKNLQMKLIGDESWMPLGRIETKDDWDLFEPKPPPPESSKKRKRGEEGPTQNGINHSESTPVVTSTAQTTAVESTDLIKDESNEDDNANARAESPRQAPVTNDVDMQDIEAAGVTGAKSDDTQDGAVPTANGDIDKPSSDNNAENQGSETGTTPPPSRRITRALAAETNTVDGGSQRSHSPSLSTVSSTLLTADPIYLLPPSLSTATRLPQLLSSLGMPIEELLETRRLLMMYIQKQEETIRGYESIQQKLYKAKRMRGQVWDWCKAEGHVGELSDGEDWIDAAAWGERAEDLKKGRDEDEVPEGQAEDEQPAAGARGRGAKGKRRRAKEKE